MLTFEFSLRLLVLQVKLPLVFILGQYLHIVSHLQGRATTHFTSSRLVLVDAWTNLSERFLFRRRLEVLVLPRISQLEVIVSLIGRFSGLWVMTQ